MAAVFVFVIALLTFSALPKSECSITQPPDQTSCTHEDKQIQWYYSDSAQMSTVQWQFINSSGTTKTIMVQAQGSNPLAQGGFNVVHISNGVINITNPTTANTGTYRITVSYSGSIPIAVSEMKIHQYEAPYGLNFTKSPLGEKTTFACTASYLGDPKATLFIQVNGTDYNTSIATVTEFDEVKCCLKNGSAICLSHSDKPYCIPAQDPSPPHPIPPGIGVALSSIVIIGTIIIIFVGRLGKVVIWILSGADIAVIVIDSVAALYGLIAGAVSVAKSVGKYKYCDTDTNCHASFGLGVTSIVMAFVAGVVLGVFIKVRHGGFGKRLSCLNTVLPVCKDTEARGPLDGKSDHPAAKEKQREVKLLTHKEQTKQHQKETEVNKGKHEEVFKGRPLPHPTGNNREDTGSAGAVSRQDVVLDRRPMPEIPSDRHKRGLSANFNDDRDKPLDDNIVHTLPVVKKPKTALDPMNAEDESKNVDDQPKKKKKKKKDRDTSRSEEMEDGY